MKFPHWLLALALFAGVKSARAELLVSSFNGNRVHRYSETNGAAIGTGIFIPDNSGGLNLPHGLATGPDGNLYVASAGNDSVLRYNGTNGAFLNAFVPSGSGGLDYPVDLVFREDGFLYVSSQLNNSVLRFNATNGAFAGTFVTNGSGGLNGPSGMAWGADGHLYVVGRFGNHLLKYDGTDGSFLGTFVAPGGVLSQPFGIRVGPDEHLYVANGNGNTVLRFHGVTGALLGTLGLNGSFGLILPVGLEFGPDSSLYVGSFSANSVPRLNPVTGIPATFVAASSGGLSGPNFMLFRPARTFSTNIPGIGPVGPIEQRHITRQFTEGPAADANGNVYFSDVQGNTIYRSDTRGLLSAFFTNSSGCNGLMFDRRGRLIACQRDQRRLIGIDVASRAVTPLATSWNGRTFIGPNDVVIDSAGGAFFSDPNFGSGQTGSTQAVYYVSSLGTVWPVATNLSRPNGVILSLDETKLYVVLSGSATLLTYPLTNNPGVAGPPTTTALPGTGDGMTLDTQGNLYLCQPSQNRLLVLSSNGVTLGYINFPEAPANCAFGGRDMKTLFVTARTSVYACRMSATGHRFAWNPATYTEFTEKFFGTNTGPYVLPSADPDGDGATNGLEYLTRTHPLDDSDAWRIFARRDGPDMVITFPYVKGRDYPVSARSSFATNDSWALFTNVWGATSPLPQTAIIREPFNTATNRFYQVRPWEPVP